MTWARLIAGVVVLAAMVVGIAFALSLYPDGRGLLLAIVAGYAGGVALGRLWERR